MTKNMITSKNTDLFMQGQCFNFALALALHLKKFNPLLLSIYSSRDDGETTVCIHCMVEINGGNLCFYVDAEGVHDEQYLANVMYDWECTELRITGVEEEAFSEVYDPVDEITTYWDHLSKADAHYDQAVFELAMLHISSHPELYKL